MGNICCGFMQVQVAAGSCCPQIRWTLGVVEVFLFIGHESVCDVLPCMLMLGWAKTALDMNYLLQWVL